MKLNVNNLNHILNRAKLLPGMGIKIKEIGRDGDRAVYVAEIPAKGHVTSHLENVKWSKATPIQPHDFLLYLTE